MVGASADGGAMAVGGILARNDVRGAVAADIEAASIAAAGDLQVLALESARIAAKLSGTVTTGASGFGASSMAANALIATNLVLTDAQAQVRDSTLAVDGSAEIAARNASTIAASNQAVTQGGWAAGSVIGSFLGAQLVGWLGRRVSYVAISIAATAATWAMFQLTEPLRPSFLPVVFVQGFVSTLFFGWLAVYLPELFPVEVRASGSGLAYNSGRFITAAGVLGSAWLFTSLGGDYPRVGSLLGLVYALGIAAIWLAPAGPSPTEYEDGGVQRVGR